MRLYVHYNDNTIILRWTEENGTLRDLRREFVYQYHSKHGEELVADDLVLTSGESSRPLDLDAKVSKLLKDKDDVTVRKRASLPQKYTPAPVAVQPATSRPAPSASPVAASKPPPTKSKYVSDDDLSGMPALEPDIDDEYARFIRNKRQPPPVGSVFRSKPSNQVAKPPPPPSIDDDEDPREDAESGHMIGQVVSSKKIAAIRADPPGKRQVTCPCSVCGEVLEFNERIDHIKCHSCGTKNINLRVVDAQSDCGRCKTKIHRRRGDITMACETCKSELVVVKCKHCATPFVAPDVLNVIPCVSCGQKFNKDECMIVSPRQSLFFLINEGINEPPTFSQRLKWKKASNPINLITQYYRDSSEERQKEIELCLSNNIKNEYIDKIHLFIDIAEHLSLPEHLATSSKIVPIRLGRRLKFKDAFDYCTKNLNDQICIVSNSDIYFDQTLRYLLQMPLGGKFLAMSRVDVTKQGHLQFNEWTSSISQDAWIFRAPIPGDIDADYYFGWLGCDNRIAYEMKMKNWHVINPSLKLICRHVHATEKRNYTQENRVPGQYVRLSV